MTNAADPDHYKHSKIEAIDYIRDTMGHEGYIYYCEGATKKYLHRFRYKGHPLEDLKKAQVYLGWMIEAYEERQREEDQYEMSLLRQGGLDKLRKGL